MVLTKIFRDSVFRGIKILFPPDDTRLKKGPKKEKTQDILGRQKGPLPESRNRGVVERVRYKRRRKRG